jgi:photosystem II stability/assembly factor-like uncharacterized protein
MLTPLWIALLLPAQAHRPHSVVTAMALAPDFETSGEAWTVMDPHDISQPMRSTDHGRHWDFVGGAPMDDEIVGASYLDDTLLLIARDGTLWSTTDGGENWGSEEVLTSTLAESITVDDSQVIIGTKAGIYAGVPGSTFHVIGAENSWPQVEASWTEVGGGAGVTDLGAVWLTDDAWQSMVRIKENPQGLVYYDAALANGNVFASTDTGRVARYEVSTDRWEDCTPLPLESTESYSQDVIKVDGTPDGRVIVATAREALFITDDDCATWDKWDSQIVPVFGGIGNATDAEEGFTEIHVVGEHGIAGGFSGIATAHEDGGDWTDSKLIPGDYCRGIAFAPKWPDDPRVFVGAYGGGVWWTENGGASWTGSAVGIDGVYSYDVQPASDVLNSGVVYYSGSNNPFQSLDDGETWTRFELPMDRVRLFRPFGNRVYALGEDQTDAVYGQVAYSDDGGTVWAEFPGNLYDEMDKAAPRDLQETTLDGDNVIIVVVDSPAGLIISGDAGASWNRVYSGERETAAGGAAWPYSDPTRLVFAAPSNGVVLSDDGGDTWTDASSPPSGRPRHMTQADDGTLFLATRDGQTWRSDDGGDTWFAVGDPLKPAIFDLVTGPDFATWGAMLVGTQAGPYWSTDAGETWALLPRYERYEDRSVHFECFKGGVEDGANPCENYSDTSHGFGGGYALGVGDELYFTFEGHEFALVGAQDGDGAVSVEISGEDHGPLTADGTKLRVDGLDPGWKDVKLVVTDAGSDGFRIDLVETWGEGKVMPVGGETLTDTGDTGGPDDTGDPCDTGSCGCRGGDAGACFLLVLPLWWRRRTGVRT